MKNKHSIIQDKRDHQVGENNLPVYASNEDIYNKSKLEDDVDPEDVFKTKTPSKEDGKKGNKGKYLVEYEPGDDLDVPGADLDDDQEKIGSEDEENNYYSLGGDGHNDLDEDSEK